MSRDEYTKSGTETLPANPPRALGGERWRRYPRRRRPREVRRLWFDREGDPFEVVDGDTAEAPREDARCPDHAKDFMGMSS